LYSLLTSGLSFGELEPIALEQDSAFSNRFFSADNYESFNPAVGAAIALVMGSAEEASRNAGISGVVGRRGVGIMLVIRHLAIFSKVDVVAAYEMPMLKMVDLISPVLSSIMTIVLFGMIFNTALSMFYAFTARFMEMNTKKANIFVSVTLVIGFAASFV